MINTIACYTITTRDLFIGILHAAKAGRVLPRLTLIVPFHAFVHWYLFLFASSSSVIVGTSSSLSSTCDDVDDDDANSPSSSSSSSSPSSSISSLSPLSSLSRASSGYYPNWQRYSLCILSLNLLLNIVGYTILLLIYRHSIRTIFNRNIPTTNSNKNNDNNNGNTSKKIYKAHPAMESFNTHLLLLRPLEIAFRFVTAPLRVLPDVIVLGETRCGTTNLCGHIASLGRSENDTDDEYDGDDDAAGDDGNRQRQHGRRMKIKCYTPFCAWAHPELDDKESFYFVGHYLGIVDPYFYRMCFPLKVTRWWEEKIRGNFFFCFDGCAQYLSSPTAPYLIASAYQHQHQHQLPTLPPPVLVACTRNPIDQAISWWKYENNAISWGESIGLYEWNTELRSEKYPPESIEDALEFSNSEFVREAYGNAERLVEDMIRSANGVEHSTSNISNSRNTPSSSNAISSLYRLFTGDVLRLPSWAITWPAGQLSSLGRSCNYDQNIKRYNHVFSTVFGRECYGEEGASPSISGGTTNDCSKKGIGSNGSTDEIASSKLGIQNGKNKEGNCHSDDNDQNQNQIGVVHVIPLESQSNGKSLESAIRPVLEQCVKRRCGILHHRRRHRTNTKKVAPSTYATAMSSMDDAIRQLCCRENFDTTRRNSAMALSNSKREPRREDVALLEKRMEKDVEWYSSLAAGRMCNTHD